jgi:xanthoxin dehydrogenase
MSNRLEGKVAAITGAASGFGAAAAQRFVKEGGRVVLGDIQSDAGLALAAQLGDAARFCVCDVTQEDHVANLVDTAVSAFGKIDKWKFTLDILLNGVFYGIKHAARAMIPQKSGSIINMASTAGIMGGLGPHAYAAAKHAVIGITKNTATELAHHGIRVNTIAPSGMATAMVAGLSGDPSDIDGTIARLAAASPLKGRAGMASDVANAALWLASDESGYTTGHTLTTDAGTTIGATTNAPNFVEYTPLIREAGTRGIVD